MFAAQILTPKLVYPLGDAFGEFALCLAALLRRFSAVRLNRLRHTASLSNHLAASAHALLHHVDLLHPSRALVVGHRQDFTVAPTQMRCDEGYLLVQAFEGVAYDPPGSGISSSNSCPQLGQMTVRKPA